MLYGKLKFNEKYNEITNINNKHEDMLMDIGVYKLDNEELILKDDTKETAVLLIEGEVSIESEGNKISHRRENAFDFPPICLHAPRGKEISIVSKGKSEVLVQKTVNNNEFDIKIYGPNDCENEYAGEGSLNNTARRVIRTIFDYNNAPYSNMVIGEVISVPGNWSSYPPHTHDQPEVYYYKFDKPQGFGCVMVGDNAYMVQDNSYITIPGGLPHPQATAPGYAMYFCWMIRHLDNNPWNKRIFEKEHEWLAKENPDIWEPKK